MDVLITKRKIEFSLFLGGMGGRSSLVGLNRRNAKHPASFCILGFCVGYPPSAGPGSGWSWDVIHIANFTIRRH